MKDQSEVLAKLAEAKADELSLLELETKTGEFGALKKNIKEFLKKRDSQSYLNNHADDPYGAI